VRRRVLHVSAAVAAATAAAALGATLAGCGSFGASPAQPAPVDGADASVGAPTVDGGAPRPDAGAAEPDGSTDAALDAYDANAGWSSPNGAKWSAGPGGVRITGYTSAAHPVIVKVPPIAISTDSYTVVATILTPSPGTEFGLVARVQSEGGAVMLGSSYAGGDDPWLGGMDSSWATGAPIFLATPYQAAVGARWGMKLKVDGPKVSGKMWRLTDPEPVFSAAVGAAYTDGRVVGFYTYGTNDAVLESLTVTEP
jgi:hypothetical protein